MPSRTGRSLYSRYEIPGGVPGFEAPLGLTSTTNALSLDEPRAGTRIQTHREFRRGERRPSHQAFEAWLQQERTRRRVPPRGRGLEEQSAPAVSGWLPVERQEVWLRLPLRAPSTGSTTSSTREPTPDNTPRTSTQDDYEDLLELVSLQDPFTFGRPSMTMTCIGEEVEEEALEEVD